MAKKSVVKIGMMSFAHMHAFSYAGCLKKLPNVEFVGIVDEDSARAKHVGRQLKVKVFPGYEEMLNSDIDAVIVCSENINHRKHVVFAAQHEKHVLCEKPISTTFHDAEAMVEVCKRSGIKLQIAFPCRFHPAFKRLKAAVDAGELGQIVGIKATNQGQCPWGWFVDTKLSGGGAVIDHTVHLMDLMRYLTGAEATRVYAEIDNRMHGKDFDDTGLLSVDFSNGMFATIDSSWSRPKSWPTWGNVNMDVVGTGGVSSLVMFAQKIDYYSEKTGRHTYQYWGDDIDLSLVESFVRSIAEDTDVQITGDDGLKALQVALAAYESAKTKETIDFLAKE